MNKNGFSREIRNRIRNKSEYNIGSESLGNHTFPHAGEVNILLKHIAMYMDIFNILLKHVPINMNYCLRVWSIYLTSTKENMFLAVCVCLLVYLFAKVIE